MPQVEHLRTREVLGVRFMHQMLFSANLEGELVVPLLAHSPYFLDQRNHIHPLEIVRWRMPEERFECSEVCAMYGHAALRRRLLSILTFIGFHMSLYRACTH